MKKMTDWIRAVSSVLMPKWRYVAETLIEGLVFLFLLIVGIVGFLPWLIWNGIRRLAGKRVKEEATDGAAERPDK